MQPDEDGDNALDQPLAPKPTIVHLTLSVVVLSGCLVLISMGISAFAALWDPCAVFTSVWTLAYSSALAFQQYRGTFRRHPGAAFMAAVLLFFVGALATLTCALMLGASAGAGGRIPWGSPLLPQLAIAATSFLAGWSNLQWSRQLRVAGPPEVHSAANSRFSLRELLLGITAIGAVTAMVSSFVRSIPPKYAEHVSRDHAPFGLPATASDISFCQGIRGTIAFEFTIAEDEFIAWVESGIGSLESNSANVALQPITTPYTIRRYYTLTRELTGPESITITKGLFYDWSKEDRGVHAAYDRTTGRAYYFAHFN
jgi:hypothetical protein